jgi:hypothetical protein
MSHDLPDMQGELRLTLDGDGRYEAIWHARTGYGVSVSIALEVPDDSVFAHDVRVSDVADNLEIHSPEIAGWLRKETRMVAHKVGKLHVSSLVTSAAEIAVVLRAGAEPEAVGYEIRATRATRAIAISRIEGGQSHPFDVHPGDISALFELAERAATAASGIAGHRKALVEARLDGTPLEEHEQPSQLVERVMREVAPMVHEMARHSPPEELVLRRLLGDNRREEIFVTKRELVDRVRVLPPGRWNLFAPLDLGVMSGMPPAPAELGQATPVPAPGAAFAEKRSSDHEVSDADLGPIEKRARTIPPPVDRAATSGSEITASIDDGDERHVEMEASEPPRSGAEAPLDPLMVDELPVTTDEAWDRDDSEPGPFEPQPG